MRQDHVSIEVVSSPSCVTLRLSGEIDMSNAPSVHESAIYATRLNPRLDMDVSGVTFMDCSGLHALLATQKRAELHGGHLRLIGPTPCVMRVLEITGVDGLFEIVTDDAVSGGGQSVAALP